LITQAEAKKSVARLKSAGFHVTAIANFCGIHRNTLNLVMSDKKVIRLRQDTLAKLDALHVSIDGVSDDAFGIIPRETNRQEEHLVRVLGVQTS
jgi:transcriptional regulator with XRE-family HTH domain